MLAREYWVDSFRQNEKKEANYEKILFPAGAAGGV